MDIILWIAGGAAALAAIIWFVLRRKRQKLIRDAGAVGMSLASWMNSLERLSKDESVPPELVGLFSDLKKKCVELEKEVIALQHAHDRRLALREEAEALHREMTAQVRAAQQIRLETHRLLAELPQKLARVERLAKVRPDSARETRELERVKQRFNEARVQMEQSDPLSPGQIPWLAQVTALYAVMAACESYCNDCERRARDEAQASESAISQMQPAAHVEQQEERHTGHVQQHYAPAHEHTAPVEHQAPQDNGVAPDPMN